MIHKYLLSLAQALLLIMMLTIPGCNGQEQAAKPDIVEQKFQFPGIPSDWYGFEKYEFSAGRDDYLVVAPHRCDPRRRWIWRAEFFGHEPQADIALLKKGWHVVYVKTAAGLYGSPQAVAIWDRCYRHLTGQYGLSRKVILEGFSRGGLLVYNWAAVNPDKVACIYADAPVCDIKSWPGGKGRGKGSPEDWSLCLKAYGLTEEQALAWNHNPIDNLEPLAKAGVPLLHVCGDTDDIVPMAENTMVLAERYHRLGGYIEIIAKKGVGHHPHSLQDPTPIVNFIANPTK
jgi:pimeloyl-ACP methyl ester carboxylesterase